MSGLRFSIATIDDVPSIVEINNSHVGSNDPGGFLVIHLDEHQVKHLIETGEMRFFIAKDEAGELMGYTEAGDSIDLTLLDDMTWIDEQLKALAESILAGRYVYVKQVAVKIGCLRKGIAGFIYRKMKEYVNCPVVVFAAITPKRNEPSIRFHEKTGYIHASLLRRINFGEFLEYESYFYVHP
ncbi:MAG: GNAT family N-acetyltransferase [Candidatus Thorarchaeota archaeon]|nr:GNAT family N-acetyltransferase [Candidatus Thorarchaeota archaeon]